MANSMYPSISTLIRRDQNTRLSSFAAAIWIIWTYQRMRSMSPYIDKVGEKSEEHA